jgi:hypothetical protein
MSKNNWLLMNPAAKLAELSNKAQKKKHGKNYRAETKRRAKLPRKQTLDKTLSTALSA